MVELCICPSPMTSADLCVNGTLYGFCAEASCGGMCEAYGRCLCAKCHPRVVTT